MISGVPVENASLVTSNLSLQRVYLPCNSSMVFVICGANRYHSNLFVFGHKDSKHTPQITNGAHTNFNVFLLHMNKNIIIRRSSSKIFYILDSFELTKVLPS